MLIWIILILFVLWFFITNLESFDNTVKNPDYSIIEIPHFLSDFECEQIILLAKNEKLEVSKVYDSTDDNIDNSSRKSEQCWLTDEHHPIIKRLSEKAAELSKTQGNFQEYLQVVSYPTGGKFNAHYDSCNGTDEFCERLNKEGFRLVTVLIYLNDNFEGGETVFPKINKTVIPQKGKAVLFYNVDENGKPIYESLHGGNPVTKGQKFIANKWIRIRIRTKKL